MPSEAPLIGPQPPGTRLLPAPLGSPQPAIGQRARQSGEERSGPPVPGEAPRGGEKPRVVPPGLLPQHGRGAGQRAAGVPPPGHPA
ncbi:unnamed protein product [Caretta caretta]